LEDCEKLRRGALRIFGFADTPQILLVKLLEEDSSRLRHHFEDVTIHPESLTVPEGSYAKERRQFQAKPFLDTLENCVSHSEHALGIVNHDLFVPELNFIFGSAQFGGNAIVALPRLRQSFYGLQDDDDLFFRRTVKEVFHELGHAMGLRHCTNHCVMIFSNSLADTDNKPSDYCPDCLSKLE
jgi:archaemetzincin